MTLQRFSNLASSSPRFFFSSSSSECSRLSFLFGDADELFAVVFLELLDDVLIDDFRHVDDLEAVLLNAFKEGEVLDLVDSLACYVLLVFLHAAREQYSSP